MYYYYYYYRGLAEDYTGLHGLKEVVAVLVRVGGRSKNSGGGRYGGERLVNVNQSVLQLKSVLRILSVKNVCMGLNGFHIR